MHGIEETLARGICIGCGACAVASRGAITISLGPTRMYEADLGSAEEDAVRAGSRVCPFSDESPNEDELGAPRADSEMTTDSRLGRFSRTFAGRVASDSYTLESSSGGLASWLAAELIKRGLADAVVSLGRAPGDEDDLFEYQALGPQDLLRHRKSHYYAATMADSLALMEQDERRYIVIGVPCFIRAARALCRERPEFSERIPFFFALVCGHYKTRAFAESLAWQLGVAPAELAEVDFRVKRRGRGANDYDFAALSKDDDDWRSAPVRSLVGGNWGHSAFQPEACNFCDDVVGETADVSFGDAWLPRFTSDSRGTNVVVSRNRVIDEIFAGGERDGALHLYEATAEDVVESQAGGFRFRREGLALRLDDDRRAGLSVPVKRVAPDQSAVSRRRALLLRQRRAMARYSHAAFAEAKASGSLDGYLNAQRREMRRYARLETSAIQRLIRFLRRVGGRVLRSLLRTGPRREDVE